MKLGLIGTGAMSGQGPCRDRGHVAIVLQEQEESGMPLEQAPATAFPRPLGALEKLFGRADQNRPMHFAIAAEVRGSTRIEQWQDALDRVWAVGALIWRRIAMRRVEAPPTKVEEPQ